MTALRRLVLAGLAIVLSSTGTVAIAAPSTIECGAALSSTVKKETAPTATSSVGFTHLPGASITVDVSRGLTMCVKVRLFAQANCVGANSQFCLVRALVDNVELPPTNSVGGVASGQPLSNAFEWVAALPQGTHVIRIVRRVTRADTVFKFRSWTLDVELADIAAPRAQ